MPLYTNPRTGIVVDEHHRIVSRVTIRTVPFDAYVISGRLIDLCQKTGRWGAACLTTWEMIYQSVFGGWCFDGQAAYPTSKWGLS